MRKSLLQRVLFTISVQTETQRTFSGTKMDKRRGYYLNEPLYVPHSLYKVLHRKCSRIHVDTARRCHSEGILDHERNPGNKLTDRTSGIGISKEWCGQTVGQWTRPPL